MPRDLPPLSMLRAFEASARHLSFKEAAAELRVTPAAISQQIKSLEDFAGVTLFRRLTRAIELTDAARQAAPMLSEAFDQMERAYAAIRTGGRAGPLTVSMPPSLASKWLVPRLGRFQEQAPDIEIRIDAAIRLVQFGREDVDMAIRFGLGRYAGLESERLFPSRTLPVCSPTLVKGESGLAEPEDLKHHTLLHLQETGAAAMEDTWALWMRAAGIQNIDPNRGPRFNTHALLIEAAEAGQGIALVEYVFAERELARGTLIQPFRHIPTMLEELGYHMVHPTQNRDDPRLIRFKDWVREERDRTIADAALPDMGWG